MSLFAAHVAAFALTAVLLVVVGLWVRREGVGRTTDAFLAVLAIDFAWVLLATLELVVPGYGAKRILYLSTNAVATATPIAWFVFTLYYTGREGWLRRETWAALGGLFAVLVVVLVTDPIHHLLTTDLTLVTEPFPYLVRTLGPLSAVYYVVLYAFILVGLLFLFQLFLTSRRASRGQVVAVIVASLVSVGVNVVSEMGLVGVAGFNYSPIGAGLFAIIAGWGLFRHQLFSVAPLARTRLFEELDDGVVVVDEDRRVVDYNRTAESFHADLGGAIGDPLDDVLPELVADPDAAGIDQFGEQMTRYTDDGPRTLAVSPTTIGRGDRVQGYALVIRDVTDIESYARRLERQTEQLDRVASTVSHDLRNPLSVAEGHVELAREGSDAADLEQAAAALRRIDGIVDDVLTLAREGRAVGDRSLVPLARPARRGWGTTPTDDATLELSVDDDCHVYADEERLQTIFENLYRNALDHAGPGVTVRVALDGNGFVVEDDGPGIPETERDRVFEYGHTTADDGTGIGLALVSSIAMAHDWTVSVEEGADGGARFRFSNVELVDRPATDAGPQDETHAGSEDETHADYDDET